jgi:hypothetical protein
MRQGDGIKIWAQMFFEDGSVTKGMRIDAEWLEEAYAWKIGEVAALLLQTVNRDEGWLLLWGAGNIVFNHYPTSFSKKEPSESDSLA